MPKINSPGITKNVYLQNPKPLVISLCDYSGIAVKPWVENGYDAHIVDIQHPKGKVLYTDGITRIGTDVRYYIPELNRKIAFVFAFPPCTHLAVSGAAHFRSKGLDKLKEAIEIVAVCNRICESSNSPYLIENPISTLSSYWRQPDWRFDPCDYAGYLGEYDWVEEAYTKRTCLWTGNGFKLPKMLRVDPIQGSKMHYLPPTKERANIRSRTPLGFSLAIFEAYGRNA